MLDYDFVVVVVVVTSFLDSTRLDLILIFYFKLN
jgi:hypothetical protein